MVVVSPEVHKLLWFIEFEILREFVLAVGTDDLNFDSKKSI